IFKMDLGYTLYWVIDAVDEAEAPTVFVKLLMQMRPRTCIKLLFLSRPIKEVTNLTTSCMDLVCYDSISVMDTIDDIRAYVRCVVHESLPNDKGIQEDIIDKVVTKAEGSFLWAKLALNTLRENWHTQDDIQRAMND